MPAKKTQINLDNLKQILVVIGLAISMIVAAMVWGEEKIKNAEVRVTADIKKLEKRMDLSDLVALKREVLTSKFFYLEQSRKYPDNQEIKDRLKEAEDEVKELKDQIKLLREKNAGTRKNN